MKTKLLYLTKIIVFLIIVFVLLMVLSFRTKPTIDSQIITNFSSVKKNTVDVLFSGTSGVMRGISPLEIYKENGITSYNVVQSFNNNSFDYFFIKDALRRQSPKVVILDVERIFDGALRENEIHFVLDGLPLNQCKLEILNSNIMEGNYDLFDRLSFVVPFFRHHNDNFIKAINKGSNKVCNDAIAYGYKYTSFVGYKELDPNYMSRKDGDLTVHFKKTHSIEYIEKIKQMLDEKGIKLVLFCPPHVGLWTNDKHEFVQKFADKLGVPFLDINMEYDKTKIDLKTDFMDQGHHLNIVGAEKLSKFMAKYLKDNYNLEDHRNDDNYSQYKNDLVKYEEYKYNYMKDYYKNLENRGKNNV